MCRAKSGKGQSAMITASNAAAHRMQGNIEDLPWQQQMRLAIRSVDELLAVVGVDPGQFPEGLIARSPFPLLVPHSFVYRMRRGDPTDPLLLQVLPLAAERLQQAGFGSDPVGDAAAERAPGLLHKYAGRALLISTGACAIHCRYCFRRHYPYAESLAAKQDWAAVVDAISADSSIVEVLLSGGDPLSLSTAKLRRLTDQLAAIPHLRRLRLHTRWPVVLPARVDSELLDWIADLPWPVSIVLHANHAQEFDTRVDQACTALRSAGALLLNQAVLLAGVNDCTDRQQQLSERLFAAGVLPYYLHLLDRVSGAGHFEVSATRGEAIIDQLRQRLPGYLVPRLAKEVAGEGSKRIVR